MKVRTDVWHYKVWAWSHLEKADSKQLDAITSLCPYFWRVMLALVWLLPVTAFLMLGKICFVLLKCFIDSRKFQKEMFHPFYSFNRYGGGGAIGEGVLGNLFLFIVSFPILRGIEIVQKFGLIFLLEGIAYVVIKIVIFAVFIALCWGVVIVGGKLEDWKNTPAENQSLLFSYLSAVKQKVCPRIEFVDKN